MKKAILAIAGLAVAAMSVPAVAQVNLRQVNQERRIDAGRRSGKLTAAEAARLRYQQRSIRVLEARLRARHGGKLTTADRRLIHARQAQANAAILREKNNGRRGKNHLKL